MEEHEFTIELFDPPPIFGVQDAYSRFSISLETTIHYILSSIENF